VRLKLFQDEVRVSELIGQGEVSTQGVDVLVVDGDDEVRTNTAATLRAAGYSVEEARDGDEAAVVMKLCQVRALVLDIGVQALDGLSALADMAQPPPVILLAPCQFEPRTGRRVASILVHEQHPSLPHDVIDLVCRSVADTESPRYDAVIDAC
jgi:CheY-like chemotaxis protein